MNAKQSRAQAETCRQYRIEQELIRARKIIEEVVTQGKFSTNVPNISLDACKQLQSEGYTCRTTYDQRDGNFTTISW